MNHVHVSLNARVVKESEVVSIADGAKDFGEVRPLALGYVEFTIK
jgi:hypothetical protein